MAQHNLGYCYFNGIGVAKNLDEAVKWFRKAADQGYVKAQSDLGACYFNGSGVAKDLVEGVKWYRNAADQGYDLAQFDLGLCYRNGEGVAKNEVEAYAYFNLAGITIEVARKNLAILEKEMSPDARIRGQQRTNELQKEIEAKQAGK
jgi:TPR repeat protein